MIDYGDMIVLKNNHWFSEGASYNLINDVHIMLNKQMPIQSYTHRHLKKIHTIIHTST